MSRIDTKLTSFQIYTHIHTSSVGQNQTCSDQRDMNNMKESALKYVKEIKKKVVKLHNGRMLLNIH